MRLDEMFKIKDICKKYLILEDFDGKFVRNIFFATPNRFSYKDKEYYVETPYSSDDGENYYIYELSNKTLIKPVVVLSIIGNQNAWYYKIYYNLYRDGDISYVSFVRKVAKLITEKDVKNHNELPGLMPKNKAEWPFNE